MKRAAFDSEIKRLHDIVGCVTHERLQPTPFAGDAASDVYLRFRTTAAIRAADSLRGGALDLRLILGLLAVGGTVAEVGVVAYVYGLLDRNETELLAYHWHPGGEFAGPDPPHLHVSVALRPAVPSGDRALLPLDKLHLATGGVSLAAFVRMLIEEFGVRPLPADWRERLADPDR